MPLAVCATPIGNLDDVSLRVLEELREADLVLCEDTRRTRILLERHGIPARTLSYHRLNEARRTAEVLPRPSAVETALVASGLATEGYRFLGYLPRGETALAGAWEELARSREAAV